jgi:hypothetical protein
MVNDRYLYPGGKAGCVPTATAKPRWPTRAPFLLTGNFMSGFPLKEFLQVIGPTASLIFAAWIFLSFLQQRYMTAYQHYRELLAELRTHPKHDPRRDSLCHQILEYKRRCEQMRRATQIGVIAAICLISAIVFGALETIDPQLAPLKYLCAAAAIGGLLLVIWAAVFVLIENARLQIIIDSDMSDLPDLGSAPSRAP